MNKNSIIGFVLIGVILFGFSWYQSRQFKKQAEYQAQLDSVARVEMLAQMAADSVRKANLPAAENSVADIPAAKNVIYKDAGLEAAASKEASFCTLANDRIEVFSEAQGLSYIRQHRPLSHKA